MRLDTIFRRHVLKWALVGSFLFHLSIFLYLTFPSTGDIGQSNHAEDQNACCLQVRIMNANPPKIPFVADVRKSETDVIKDDVINDVLKKSTSSFNQDSKIIKFSDVPLPGDAVNLGGIVEVSFSVNRNGIPENILVVNASPIGVFEEWAIAMVEQGLYKPTIQNGAYVSTTFRVLFTIDAGEVQIQSH